MAAEALGPEPPADASATAKLSMALAGQDWPSFGSPYEVPIVGIRIYLGLFWATDFWKDFKVPQSIRSL